MSKFEREYIGGPFDGLVECRAMAPQDGEQSCKQIEWAIYVYVWNFYRLRFELSKVR